MRKQKERSLQKIQYEAEGMMLFGREISGFLVEI
jgi:hypothetical protein